MRILHARFYFDDEGTSRPKPAAFDGRDPSLFIREPMPLRDLPRHHTGGQSSIRKRDVVVGQAVSPLLAVMQGGDYSSIPNSSTHRSKQILPLTADLFLELLARFGNRGEFIQMVIGAAGIDDRLGTERRVIWIGDIHRIIFR